MIVVNNKDNYIGVEISNTSNLESVVMAMIDSGYWVKTKKESNGVILYIKEAINNGN